MVKLSLSVDDETLRDARRLAEAMGTSVNQLVRDYLGQLAGRSNNKEAADEFVRLSLAPKGDSEGWKFNRDEIHRR